MLRLTRSMTLVAGHSARSEAESRNPEKKWKDMDPVTTRRVTEESKQDDVNNQAPTLLTMAPGKNNARSMSHSETGKARRGYPENRKDMDAATYAQHDIRCLVIPREAKRSRGIQKRNGKTWMLRLTRRMTLVAIIAFHCSSHSVVSRSEIAPVPFMVESRKEMERHRPCD